MNRIDENIIRIWSGQLLKEYENICFQYRLRLKKPVIEIIDNKNYPGMYLPEKDIIQISSLLIRSMKFRVVKNILKHEIAHKIVYEKYGVNDNHGQYFQMACEKLFLPQNYRKASLDYSDIENKKISVDERLMMRIEKLFSLAQSANENEALLAMEKANELLIKYNLNFRNDKENSHYSHRIIYLKRKRIEAFTRNIMTILKDYYFVDMVISSEFDASQCEEYRIIELFGTAENTEIAHYIFDYLNKELEYLWKNYRKKNKKRLKLEKKSFYLGVLNGFEQKLKMRKLKDYSSEKYEIVFREDPGLNNYIAKVYPKLRRSYSRSSRINKNSYESGIDAGKNIIIKKGINSDMGNKGFLLK